MKKGKALSRMGTAATVERLEALLTGRSESTRTNLAMAPASETTNLLLGVALHGADRVRQGKTPTDLERLLLDALDAVVDREQRDAWGAAYRRTVDGAGAGSLTVPAIIAERPVSSGFSMADLGQLAPGFSWDASKAPNVSLYSAFDLAAGAAGDSEEFLQATQERGFGVTGVARHSTPGRKTRARAGAGSSWRVRLQMDSFHVVRAVGDQGGGKDEIYFTAASSVGGDGGGQTFHSQEFGSVEKGDTRHFSDSNKVFLDKPCDGDIVVTSIQVWEADQSNSRWYDALQQGLNRAVETIDNALDNPLGSSLDPTPFPVSVAYEVAKVFIGLMDVLRNDDDLSCQRTFVLTRDDLAVLYYRPEMEWQFNGDGHHALRVTYTGERPKYPTGSVEIVRGRNTGPTAHPWDAPIPLGWQSATPPALARYKNDLYAVFSRPEDSRLLWSRFSKNS